MNKPKLVVALTGIARSGKDTFCELLAQELAKLGLRAKRFALADDLKEEVRPFILQHYGIDILNCSVDQKELVRDFLVFHGKMKRIASAGTHWTNKLETKIRLSQDVDVAIVTDVRYDVYPEDELVWAKQKMGGVVVHIKRHNIINYADVTCGLTASKWTDEEVAQGYQKVYVQPPNRDEATNDPKLEAQADFKVDWATGDIEKFCRPVVQEFIKVLKHNYYI